MNYKGLFLAVKCNDMSEVVQKVEEGADVNMKDKNNYALLHFSTTYDMISYLIRKGADVNAANCNGDTPLHLSVQAEEQEAMNTLLMYNADTSIENNDEWTPLMNYFDKKPFWKEEIIETLLNYESYVNRVNCNGETILTKAFVEKSSYKENIIQYGGNINNLLCDTMVLRWCASSLAELEDFQWFWDIYKYKESWNCHRSILDYLVENSQFSKLNYVIRSTKLKDVFDIMSSYEISKKPSERCYLITALIDGFRHLFYIKDIAEEGIYILLSHGYVPSEEEAIEVYKVFGYAGLFTFFLHLDLPKTSLDSQPFNCLMPKILLNPGMCITVLIELCTKVKHSVTKSTRRVTSYIFDKKLNQFIEKHRFDRYNLERCYRRKVPRLLELCRNQTRLVIWKGCKPQSTSQFYSVVKWMNISERMKNVITFKQPIYKTE